jgi:hypothetical protein
LRHIVAGMSIAARVSRKTRSAIVFRSTITDH